MGWSVQPERTSRRFEVRALVIGVGGGTDREMALPEATAAPVAARLDAFAGREGWKAIRAGSGSPQRSQSAAHPSTRASHSGQRPGGETASRARAIGPVRAPNTNQAAGFRPRLVAYHPAIGAPIPIARITRIGTPSMTPCTLPPMSVRSTGGHATPGSRSTGRPHPSVGSNGPADWCGDAPEVRPGTRFEHAPCDVRVANTSVNERRGAYDRTPGGWYFWGRPRGRQ
jgi:hypothetical protein